MWNSIQILAVLFSALTGPFSFLFAADFASNWPEQIERVWAGPEYWTNPLPDWRVSGGRLECWRSGGDRNAYLLTRELSRQRGTVEMSVTLGQLEPEERRLTEGWVGFKVGSLGEFNDTGTVP